jgi:hypothetical protein
VVKTLFLMLFIFPTPVLIRPSVAAQKSRCLFSAVLLKKKLPLGRKKGCFLLERTVVFISNGLANRIGGGVKTERVFPGLSVRAYLSVGGKVILCAGHDVLVEVDPDSALIIGNLEEYLVSN